MNGSLNGKSVASNAHLARVVRTLFERWGAGAELDEWLAFPQNSCCVLFGASRRPLPIGALRLLWRAGHPWSQQCAACGHLAFAYGFGGLLVVGGINLVCENCGALRHDPIGGLGAIKKALDKSPLIGTRFAPSGVIFGAPAGSDGIALLHALGLPPIEPEPQQPVLAVGPQEEV